MNKLFTLIGAAALMAAVGAQAQTQTYILDINKIYADCKAQVDAETGPASDDSKDTKAKLLLNEQTITQGIFTVVSKKDRTYRVDLYNPDKTTEDCDYDDYTAETRLEPNGASNKTGGRQMFVDVAYKGVLYLGVHGAYAADKTRTVFVSKANDKETYVPYENGTHLWQHTFAAEDEKTTVYEIGLEPGTYVISQDQGVNYYYVKFTEGAEEEPTSIESAEAGAPVSVEYYNVAGARVDGLQSGINIVRTTYEGGKVVTSKVRR